LTYGTLFSDKV